MPPVKLSLGLIGLIGVYTVIALAALVPVETLQWSRAVRPDIEHSDRQALQLVELLSLLQDVETGQRGFVITGKEEFLEPYHRGVEGLQRARPTLRAGMAAADDAARIMSELDALIDAKLGELADTIHVRRGQGFNAVEPIVSAGTGKVAMDRIRSLLGSLRVAEQRRKDALLAELHRRQKITAVAGLGAAGIGLTLLAALIFHLYRVIRARQAAEWQAQTNFHFLAESVPQMIWTAAPDGTADYYNRRWYAYTGMTPEQAAGGAWAPIHPDDLPTSMRAWDHSVSSGEAYQVEHRFQRAADGAYRWHLCRALPLRNQLGVITKWFGTCTDIHDYKETLAKNLALQAQLELRVLQRTVELNAVNTELAVYARELARSNERHELAVGAAEMGVWEWDFTSNALRWDDHMYRLYGAVRDGDVEPLSSALEKIHAADRAEVWASLSRARSGGGVFDSEFRIHRADGEVLFLKAHGKVQCDTGGVPVRMVGVSSDITRRKSVEQALKVANERLALATRGAGIGIWDWNLKADSVRWDEQMYRLYGQAPVAADHSVSAWIGLLHGDDRERFALALERSLSPGGTFDAEFRTLLPSGEIRHLRAAAQLVTGSLGVPSRMIGVNWDVTEQARAAEALQKTSSLLRMVLDSATDLAIIATAPDFTVTVFNQGAERMLGYTSAELVDATTPLLLHDVGEMTARAAELTAAPSGPSAAWRVFTDPSTLHVEREWTFVGKDQRRIPVSLTYSEMRGEGGVLTGYLGVARDISKAREHEAALREAMARAERANAAKSQFLANMSHEIRTPLNAVIGLGHLLEQTAPNDEQREYLVKLQFAGRSLLGVVNNVLDLSKIEMGEMLLEDTDFDLLQLAQQIGEMLSPQARGKGIELNLRSESDLPRFLRGDPTRLGQIITNLVSNAIKFTDRGHVDVVLSCRERTATGIRLRGVVRDTGIGMAPEALARIFTPFAQADTSTTRRFGGTGLGLSITRRFVELMAGEMGVHSEPNAGSEFWFEILLHLPEGALVPLADSSRPLQILIIEAHGASPSPTALLGPLGCVIHAAATVDAGVARLRDTRNACWPDAIVLCATPGALEPLPVIRTLRQEFSTLQLPPILVVQGAEADGHLETRLQQEADAVMTAPITGARMFAALSDASTKRKGSLDGALHSIDFNRVVAQWLYGVRVLVVDDSEVNRIVAERILTKQGAIVGLCGTGADAVARLRETPDAFDIVLMDVQMPLMDGNQATERIRNDLELSTLPIIALTAGALVSERDRALQAGMNDFLTKPFEPATLIRIVRRIVEDARGGLLPVGIVNGDTVRTRALEVRLSSIDSKVIDATLGGDRELFLSLVIRLLRDFGDCALPVSFSLADAATRRHWTERMHKLRGSAGAIGATTVQQYAHATERALAAHHPAALVDPLLSQVAAALTALAEEAQPWIDADESRNGVTPAAAAPPATRAAIDELLKLLDDQDLDAADRFTSMSASLLASLGETRCEQLRRAVNDLDFLGAAELLRGHGETTVVAAVVAGS